MVGTLKFLSLLDQIDKSIWGTLSSQLNEHSVKKTHIIILLNIFCSSVCLLNSVRIHYDKVTHHNSGYKYWHVT